MSDLRPERGGVRDFHGRLRPEYSPHRDGEPDPGEIVWTWVTYEEDPAQGKDRPVVVVGRDEDEPTTLVALMLSSQDHDGDEHWHRIGTGAWDGASRTSWVRVDRPLAVTRQAVRREGSALEPDLFLAVVEHAAGLRDRAPARAHLGPARASSRVVSRLVGVYRARGGPLGEVAYAVRRALGRGGCSLRDVARGTVRPKPEWDRMARGFGVPFDLVPVDRATGETHALVPSRAVAPAVLAEVAGRLEVVLSAHEIEPLSGSVVAFERALTLALARRSLVLR